MLGKNICRWFLLFQKFDIHIIVKLGRLNLGPDDRSRLESGEELVNLDHNPHDAQFFVVKIVDDHNKDIVHILTIEYAPKGFNSTQNKQLIVNLTYLQLITR